MAKPRPFLLDVELPTGLDVTDSDLSFDQTEACAAGEHRVDIGLLHVAPHGLPLTPAQPASAANSDLSKHTAVDVSCSGDDGTSRRVLTCKEPLSGN